MRAHSALIGRCCFKSILGVILLDPDSTVPVVVFVVLLALHAFFAASKEAISSVRKSRRLQFIEEGKLSEYLNLDGRFCDAVLLACLYRS